mmetsp:Transcript_18159/g.41198  ORF Transcript_18159/g.41198 Transcript_18159/m.41198 type:complete len:200 (-) Transcript_18159:144-743(-)
MMHITPEEIVDAVVGKADLDPRPVLERDLSHALTGQMHLVVTETHSELSEPAVLVHLPRAHEEKASDWRMVTCLFQVRLAPVAVLHLQSLPQDGVQGLEEAPGGQDNRRHEAGNNILHPLHWIRHGSRLGEEGVEVPRLLRGDLEDGGGQAALDWEADAHDVSSLQQRPAHLPQHHRQHASTRLHLRRVLAAHPPALVR